jgi:hypothetical protein
MKTMQASKLIGTALICFGLLSFEIVTARILGVVLETHLAIFAIALAMLGMGAATSAMSLGDSPERRTTHPLFFSYTGAFLGLSYVACFVGIAIFNVDTNADVENAIDQG